MIDWLMIYAGVAGIALVLIGVNRLWDYLYEKNKLYHKIFMFLLFTSVFTTLFWVIYMAEKTQ